MVQLTFWGAAGTVTGSKYLLETPEERVLIDCGLFQGMKELRLRNWAAPEYDASAIHWLLLTHAHIDHTGYVPRFVHEGFRGAILTTPPTLELARILLHDSAHLQEEDARFLNKKELTKHEPALPLYTTGDADRALQLFQAHEYGTWYDLSPRLRVRWRDAGHLLGSASIDVVVREGDRQVHVLFSGDVGRYGMPLNHDPTPPGDADYLLVESTYGDRVHPSEPPAAALEGVLRRMLERRGVLLVPAFAIGRAQQIIYLTLKLIRDGTLPAFPIYLDSPMAVDATAIYCKYLDDHPLRLDQLQGDDCVLSGPSLHFTHSVEDSKRLNDVLGPAMIISSSGMLTGGRILHHLVRRLPDPKNLVALVGYQAAGTRGRMLQEGAKTLPILGEEVPVHAEVVDLGHLSGHGDRDELLRWMDGMPNAPKRVFVTHGEPAAAAALAEAVHARRGWDVLVPQHGQRVDL